MTNYSDEVYRIVARDRARYKLIKVVDILPISYLPRQLLKVDAKYSKEKNEIQEPDPVKRETDKSKARKRLKREGSI